MNIFLVTLILVALCVLGLCFNVIVRKKDFPHYDVGSNEQMRQRGIRCYKDEDAALHKKKCAGQQTDACKECKMYELSSDNRKA